MRAMIPGGALLFLVLVSASNLEAQTLDCTPLQLSGLATATVSEGTPGMPFFIAIDQDPGPVEFWPLGTVHLGFSTQFAVFPPGVIGAGGEAVWSAVLGSDPVYVNRIYYAQASLVDPSALLGHSLTNGIQRGIHPPSQAASTTQILVMGDNTSESIVLPADVPFSFYGQVWSQIEVSSNGLISFGQSWETNVETPYFFSYGPPKIAVLWDDFAPHHAGNVIVQTGPQWVRVIWDQLPQAHILDSSTFDVTLHADGTISMSWPQVQIPDGLVGISGGSLMPVTMQDLSHEYGGVCTFQEAPMEQWFDPQFPNDLQGARVTFAPIPTGYLWYR